MKLLFSPHLLLVLLLDNKSVNLLQFTFLLFIYICIASDNSVDVSMCGCVSSVDVSSVLVGEFSVASFVLSVLSCVILSVVSAVSFVVSSVLLVSVHASIDASVSRALPTYASVGVLPVLARSLTVLLLHVS